MSRIAEELLIGFLEGDLSTEKERDALHEIAEDQDARVLLRFELGLRSAFAEGSTVAVPERFADGVMAAVAVHEARRPSAQLRDLKTPASSPRRIWEELRRPRTVQWRPAHALLALAASAVVLWGVIALGVLPAAPRALMLSDEATAGGSGPDAVRTAADVIGTPILGLTADTVLVRFTFADAAAGSVAVAGDFSRWNPIQLTPHIQGGTRIWVGVVPVPRGEHRYMFVVDGSRWVTDPLAPVVRDDGFGNRNAVLSL